MSTKVYTIPTCPYCRKTKQLLVDHRVNFEEVDVSSSQESAREMHRKSGQMVVPVLDADGKIIIGFDEQAILDAFKIKQVF